MTLLEVKDLRVFYRRVEGLHRASLRVEQGSIVTVIGPNGAGKSTLLGALMGLLRCTGEVRFAGSMLGSEPVESRVARGLCLVPERRELFGELSVEDNLLLGAFHRERRHGVLQNEAVNVYQRFPRLQERRDQLAGTLSGGERQMLALGRALMARPKLLMLDEPSLGLAPLVVREVLRDRRAACRRRVDPAGRAERARRAPGRRLRLRARNRRDGARGQRRRAARQSSRGGDLSWPCPHLIARCRQCCGARPSDTASGRS